MGYQEVAGILKPRHHGPGGDGVGRGHFPRQGFRKGGVPGAALYLNGKPGVHAGSGWDLQGQSRRAAAVHTPVQGEGQLPAGGVIGRIPNGTALHGNQRITLRESAGDFHRGGKSGHAVVPGSEVHGNGSAQHGFTLGRGHADWRLRTIRVVNGDAIFPGRFVPVVIHHGNPDGVVAIGQIDAAANTGVVRNCVFQKLAIHIKGRALHTGIVAVCLYAVVENSLNIQRAGSQLHVGDKGDSICPTRFYRGRFNLRGGGVFWGTAVHIGQVVKIEGAGKSRIANPMAFAIKFG